MNSKKMIMFIIILAGCITQFASDVYAPALPNIAQELSTSANLVQWSMAIYMFAVALSMLIYGPWSEMVGRKTPLLFGLAIFLVGSLICFFADSITALLLGRLIQGLGAGASASMWRSIFRDSFEGNELAKYGSYLTMAIVFVIPAAPMVGGYLDVYLGWRSIFVLLSIYALLTLLVVKCVFKDTHRNPNKKQHTARHILKTYHSLLIHPIFLGLSLVVFLAYGAYFSWFVATPILLIHHLGMLPNDYGWLVFIIGLVTYVLAGRLNAKLVMHLGTTVMLRIAFSVYLFAGMLMLAGWFILGMTFWSIVIPGIIAFFGSAFIWPNVTAIALTPFGHIAGYASAMYGFLQLLGAAVLGGIIAHLPTSNQIPLAMSIITAILLAWIIFEIVVNPRLKKQNPQS